MTNAETNEDHAMAIFTSNSLRKISALFILGIFIFLAWHPPIQALANSYVDTGLQRTLLSFATARALNASISVLQGTELSIQPLGVGLTFTLGKILTPINDLIEKFSTLMLWASISYGIQKTLLVLLGEWWLSAVFSIIAAIWSILFVRSSAPDRLTKVLLLVMIFRFAVPISAVATEIIYSSVFEDEYSIRQEGIASLARQTQELSESATSAKDKKVDADAENGKDTIVDKVRRWLEASKISTQLDSVKEKLEKTTENIISLIVIFIFQTAILPLAFLWGFYKAAQIWLWRSIENRETGTLRPNI